MIYLCNQLYFCRCLAIINNPFKAIGITIIWIKRDIKAMFKDSFVMKIDWQPCDNYLNQLEHDFSAIATSISTTNGGELHGHIGLIVKETDYIIFSCNDECFIHPVNPSVYPTTVRPRPAFCDQQVAKHKVKIVEFETYLGVKTALWDLITKAVNKEWLEALWDEKLGFTNIMPLQMLNHLCTTGGTTSGTWISWKNSISLPSWWNPGKSLRTLWQNLHEMTKLRSNWSKPDSPISRKLVWLLHSVHSKEPTNMIQQFKSGSKANSRQNICQCPTLHHCRVCQMQQVQQSNCKFCSHGLTNAATTKINHKQLQAWTIAKVANAI